MQRKSPFKQQESLTTDKENERATIQKAYYLPQELDFLLPNEELLIRTVL